MSFRDLKLTNENAPDFERFSDFLVLSVDFCLIVVVPTPCRLYNLHCCRLSPLGVTTVHKVTPSLPSNEGKSQGKCTFRLQVTYRLRVTLKSTCLSKWFSTINHSP